MKLRSWNRFKVRAFAVEPSLMGSSATFVYNGVAITIKTPPLDRVGDTDDEDALATCDTWKADTGEPINFDVRAVDVITDIQSEVKLPDSVLTKHPNAYDLIDNGTQATLNAAAGAASSVASCAFEYWIALIRWVTGFHRVGREARVGHNSGWSTRLHDCSTGKPVWIESMAFVVTGIHTLTTDEWQQVLSHAAAGNAPPMHATLLDDAKHCIDVGDYRRALVDLSVACEVYLRNAVLNSLPPGVLEEAVRLIEEANINQYVAHMFPALLSDGARQEYKKIVKGDLSSLFTRRNKLMHVAAFDGANRESCERFRRVLEALFLLELRSKA